MRTMLAVAVLAALSAPVQAQYYADPPPPGYYPGPRYEGPRYGDPRYGDPRYGDPRYGGPRYEGPRGRFGRACEAFLPPEYGSRRIVCPIVQAKPLGEECACPPPPPPPGYAPGPYVGGRTIR